MNANDIEKKREEMMELIDITKRRNKQGSSAHGCFAVLRSNINALCDELLKYVK